MKSMTGYGSKRQATNEVSLEVSVRCVNGRFLETRFHLPREFIAFENDLRRSLSEKVKRGTVDIFVVRRVRNLSSNAEVFVNRGLAKKYVQAYRQLAKETGITYQPHLEAIARLPDVIKIEEGGEVSARESDLLKKTFREAVQACDKERLREGQALRKDLEKTLDQLEKKIRTIQQHRHEADRHLQDKFESKIKTRLQGGEIDPQRLSQEIVIQLEKSDIAEEVSRLSEHVKNYKKLLGSAEAEGKKLDFYTQELLREVNTIGSKSQVAPITQNVVEAKTLIERLREQVQNVE